MAGRPVKTVATKSTPGGRPVETKVVRTVIVRSERLPRRAFKVLSELEGMYRNVVEQLVLYAAREGITSFTKLKALRYRELRELYPQLPSHYVYTACQDAATRVKSFVKLKKMGLTSGEFPTVRKVSVWLDDHLWKLEGLTAVSISTHRGRVRVELELHKQLWRYMNSSWRLASEAKMKLNKRERRLLLYLTFRKEVEPYETMGYLAVDVNEDNVALLADGKVYVLETGIRKIVLGYHHRRKRIQEKHDRLYGVKSRAKRKVMRKLKERKKKEDVRLKAANLIVREAFRLQYGIVLEKFGNGSVRRMVSSLVDDMLRHRIFQAAFRGIQRAIEEKAKEYGVPVIYVDPRNTSRLCPVHRAEVQYDGSRVGVCSSGGERWHRDVLACWNLLLKALGGDGSNAPSLPGLKPGDGSPVPLARRPPMTPRGSHSCGRGGSPWNIQGQTALKENFSVKRGLKGV